MFGEKLNEAQEEYGTSGGGSTYFKFKEGKNRLRVLTDSEVIANHWVGGGTKVCFGIKNGCPFHGAGALKNAKGEEQKPTAKSVVYVLNKNAEPYMIQIAELPWSVTKGLDNLSKDDEWGFSKLPMEYDIIVTVTGAGTMSAEYQILPSPKDKGPLPDDVKEKLAKLPTVKEYIDKKKQKAKNESIGVASASNSDVQIGEDKAENVEEIDPADIPF